MERTGWIAYVNEGFSHAAGEQHPWAWAAATSSSPMPINLRTAFIPVFKPRFFPFPDRVH